MKIVVIASCSSSKSIPKELRVEAESLEIGQIKQVVSRWKRLLDQHLKHTDPIPSGQLYQGRAIQEIKKVASELNCPVYFISAGLGLVDINEQISAYSLTVSKGSSDYVGDKIVGETFNKQLWWQEINSIRGNTPLHTMIKNNNDTLFLLALPANYFAMVVPELMKLTDPELNRVRLFGPAATKKNKRFDHVLMPYDNRFNGPDSPLRGTYSDFPQRALRHFVSIIDNKLATRSPVDDSELVSASLSKMRSPPKVIRKQASDEQISLLLQRKWAQYMGQSSSKSLRRLRDVELTACEQKRFSGIFQSVKKLMGGKNGR